MAKGCDAVFRNMHRTMVAVVLIVLVVVLVGCSAAPVLHGDLRYLYYGEVPLGSLNDGGHRRRLVPVPDEERDTGADIVDPQALEETPDVVLDVVDRTLVRVLVELKRQQTTSKPQRPRHITLLPFRILISDGGDDETAEDDARQHVVLNARSNHAIHEDEATFQLDVPLFHMDPHALYFIRLDTYSRRTTRFVSAFWLPTDLPRLLTARGQEDDAALLFTLIPSNASFGTRFDCRLGVATGHANSSGVVGGASTGSTAFRLSVVSLRKPPIPPQRLWVDLIEVPAAGRPQLNRSSSTADDIVAHSKEEARALLALLRDVERRAHPMRPLAAASSGAPTAHGLTIEDAFALDPSAKWAPRSNLMPLPQMHPAASDNYRFVVRIATEYEELTRQFRETYVLTDATKTLKALRVVDKSERLMLPLSFLARLRDAQTVRKELLPMVRDEHYVKLKLQYSSEQASLSLLVLQPFPIKNLQVLVVDGRNATIFVEEEYDVPYIGPHDAGSHAPFGWRRVVDDGVLWIAGDAVACHVFYDLRDPPVPEAELAAVWAAATECDEYDENGFLPTAVRLGGSSIVTTTGNDDTVPLSFRLAARGLATQHHHAIRDQFETVRGYELLWNWLERYEGVVHPMLGITTASRASSSPLLALSSNVTNASTWPMAGTELLGIPADVILSVDTVRTVSFVHLLFASEAWVDLRKAWSQPDRADLRTLRGTLDMYSSDRLEQVLMITLFSLTQAEHVVTGVRFHSWLKTMPKRAVDTQQVCFPMLHTTTLAAALDAHGLSYFATVLRRRRAYLEDVYDLLEDAWPWLVPNVVSLDMLLLRYSLLEAMALEGRRSDNNDRSGDSGSDRLVYIAPSLSWCVHGDAPTASVAYDTLRRMLVASVAPSISDASLQRQCHAMEAEGVLARGRWADADGEDQTLCRRVVTCDWSMGYHEGSKSMGRLTTLECLLRRGAVYGAAEGVVDVTVRHDPATAPQWFANRTFLLTREVQSRDAVLEFVAYVVCRGGRVTPKRRYVTTPNPTASYERARDVDACAKRHLQWLLQERQREIALTVSLPFTSSASTCNHMHATVASILVGAHRVIAVHLHALQTEADTSTG